MNASAAAARAHAGALATCVLVCVVAIVVLALVLTRVPQARLKPATPLTDMLGGLGSQSWVVVGSGLAATSFLRRLPNTIRSVVTIREASQRVGGRTTSTAQAVTPVSTQTSPWEFGAWAYRPFAHPNVSSLLDELGVASVSIALATPYTFVWTASGRRAYSPLPLPTADVNVTQDQWFAHTGFRPAQYPLVDTRQLMALDLPETALLPTGFGWQDVVLRGIGTVPVIYGRQLSRVDVLAPSTSKAVGRKIVKLTYSSGNSEMVDGVVLTLPPPAMLTLQNLPLQVARTIREAFTTAAVGVLYATWASMDVWWPKVGFFNGVVASYLPIGRICVSSPNDLRCTMSGDADVGFWNDVLVNKGQHAAALAVADQLSQTFGVTVPAPASVTYKAWMQAVSLWNAGVDRNAAAANLARPWGADVPIWWASADVTDFPGWVEGAVVAGSAAARDVSEYVLQAMSSPPTNVFKENPTTPDA